MATWANIYRIIVHRLIMVRKNHLGRRSGVANNKPSGVSYRFQCFAAFAGVCTWAVLFVC